MAVAAIFTKLLPIRIVASMSPVFLFIRFRILADSSSYSLSCLIFAIVIDVIAVSELENNAENSSKTATIPILIYILMPDKVIPPITQSPEKLVQ